MGSGDVGGELVVEHPLFDDELLSTGGDRVGDENVAQGAAWEAARPLKCAFPVLGCERVDVDETDHGFVACCGFGDHQAGTVHEHDGRLLFSHDLRLSFCFFSDVDGG